MGPWRENQFYDAIYSPVVLLLNAAVVGIVMLLSALGECRHSSPVWHVGGYFGCGYQLYFPHFTPIESLGMEIQTIQSAMAGVRRIDAFLAVEQDIPQKREQAAHGDIVFFSCDLWIRGKNRCSMIFSMKVRREQVTLVGRTGAEEYHLPSAVGGFLQAGSGDHHHRRRRCCQDHG